MSGDDKYMLCSMCKKNQAVVFSSKEDNGQRKMDGLCIPCARKQGINTDEILKAQNTALSQMQLKDVNNQLEGLFKNLAENLGNIDSIELGAMPINNINNDADDTDNDSEDLNDEQSPIFAGAIPLGSIFGNFNNFNGSNKQDHSTRILNTFS